VSDLITQHYKENYDKLYKRASRSLQDYSLSEDCVQEAYERALKYYKNSENDNFEAWFNRVFFNTILKYLGFIRSRGVTEDAVLTEDIPLPMEFISDYRDYIVKEISKYSSKAKLREVLTLYIIKGYSADEVHTLTGVGISSIKQNAFQFKKRLKESCTVGEEN